MLKKGGVKRKKGVGSIYTSDSLVIKEPVSNKLPGINSQKINPDIEIQGNSGGGFAKTRLLNFDATPLSVGQVFEFDQFGFTPKKVMIQGSAGVGLGYFNIDGVKTDQTTNRNSESGVLMYLDNGGGGPDLFTAFLHSFTSDGFKITIQSKTDDVFFCYATCFSEV